MPETERETALHEALAIAKAISDKDAQARALTALAPHLPEAERDTALRDALAAAKAIYSDGARASALAALAPHLSVAERETAMRDALVLHPLEAKPGQTISVEMLALLEEAASAFSSKAVRVMHDVESQILAAREDNARLNTLNDLVTKKLDEIVAKIPSW